MSSISSSTSSSSPKLLFTVSSSSSSTALSTHTKPFTCETCLKSFSSNGNLKHHINTIHNNNRPFKCPFPQCIKAFPSLNRLNIHKRTHQGIKPFRCCICFKTFNEKGNLKTHLMFHSSERNFKCLHCNKAYKTKHHLKEHVEIFHEKIKRFKCDICNCSFGKHSHLNAHLQTHNRKKVNEYEENLFTFYEQYKINNNNIDSEWSNSNNTMEDDLFGCCWDD